MKLSEVPLWIVSSNIGHAVASERGGYIATACGTWGNFIRGVRQAETPKRICRKCRDVLKDAMLIKRNES